LKKKKVAYIGSSHHVLHTKSTCFILDLLSCNYDLTIFLTDPEQQWKQYQDEILLGDWHALIVMQSIPPIFSNPVKCRNLIFISMYDQHLMVDRGEVLQFRKYKILSFSETQTRNIHRRGCSSLFVRYFPELTTATVPALRKLFFWQRRPEIHWGIVKQLFAPGYLEAVHLHLSPDWGEAVMPSEQEIIDYNITISKWFNKVDDMHDIRRQYGLFIAPRSKEGIGHSFLEAMADNMVVIAHNDATMNEYIQHGQTGYIVNMSAPDKLDLSNAQQILNNLPSYMAQGRDLWLSSIPSIYNYIDKPLKCNWGLLSIETIIHTLHMSARSIKRFLQGRT